LASFTYKNLNIIFHKNFVLKKSIESETV